MLLHGDGDSRREWLELNQTAHKGVTISRRVSFNAMDVYSALGDAASQDPALAQASFRKLEELHKTPGALAEMVNIAATKTAPLDIRRIAIIQFKNHGTSNWRSKV